MIVDNKTWGSIWIVVWSILLILDCLFITDVYVKIFLMGLSMIFILLNIYYGFIRGYNETNW